MNLLRSLCGLALSGRHAQMLEQSRKVGIGALAINEKPGINRDRCARDTAIDRVGMPAKSIVRLNQRHCMALRQQPSGIKA